MSDLACQFMDVMFIPQELDKILQEKSHGVPSWCEQLIKDMLVSKIVDIAPEVQAFQSEDDTRDLYDKYNEICDKVMESGTASPRPGTPSFRSTTPLLPDTMEDDPLVATKTREKSAPASKGRRGSLLAKITLGGEERTRKRRMSTGSAKGTELENEFDNEQPPTIDNTKRNSLTSESNAIGFNFNKEKKVYYGFEKEHFVKAKSGTMPKDTQSVCIIAPGVDISKVVVPESVKDMVLARVDRMSPSEQVSLKCASILGMMFSRELIEALVPISSKASLDLVLYTLVRDGILECASLAAQHQSAHNHHGFYDYDDPAHAHHHGQHHHHHHHHNVATSLHAPVLCGCYAHEGNRVRLLEFVQA